MLEFTEKENPMSTRKNIACLLLCFIFLLTGCKSKEAKAVDDAILSIGQVSSENTQAVKDAYAMYEALTEEQKEEVENFNILNEANNLVVAMEFDAMVETLIQDIAQKNTLTFENVDALQAQYNQLPQSQKDLVINNELLEEAREMVCANILAEADENYDEMLFSEAYQLYLQLPQDYPGFDESKFAACKRIHDICRTWVPRDAVSVGSDSVEYTPLYASFTLAVDTDMAIDAEGYLERFDLSVTTELLPDEILAQSVFGKKPDVIKDWDFSSINKSAFLREPSEPLEDEVYVGNNGWYYRKSAIGVSLVMYHFFFYNEETNEIRVETDFKSNFLTTTVSHYYVPAD